MRVVVKRHICCLGIVILSLLLVGGTSNAVANTTLTAPACKLKILGFSASPNPFNPNSDGGKGTTRIKASFNFIAKWNIQLRSMHVPFAVVRAWSGTGKSTSVVWDGKNNSGVKVPDGIYAVTLTGTYALGAVATASIGVMVRTLPTTSARYVGWWSSLYGVHYDQKPASWFISTAESMAASMKAEPLGVWMMGNIQGSTSSGYCALDIPKPSGTYSHVTFRTDNQNPSNAYLTTFDAAGLKIVLEIEPAAADINTLTKLLMDTFAHHPCVTGVCIDCEWYPHKVTAALAQSWTNYLQSNYGSKYKVFITYYDVSQMPADPKIPGCIWMDDSQGFNSEGSMLSDFSTWKTHFSGSNVGYFVGYSSDSSWTRQIGVHKILTDASTLGSNVKYVIWADEDILHYYP